MPKPDEIARRHADATITWWRPGASGLGHATHASRVENRQTLYSQYDRPKEHESDQLDALFYMMLPDNKTKEQTGWESGRRPATPCSVPCTGKSTAQPWRRLTRAERLTILATLIVLTVATVGHLPPGVCFSDGGDLQLASATLGIMHPPGYPGYVTLGYLITKIPGVEPAYLISLACLAAGLTAIALGILLAVRTGIHVGIACTAFICFAMHKHIWRHLVAPEVYAPSLAFLLGAAYLLIKYARVGRRRDLYIAGLLFGFVLANRPTVVYMLPFFAVAWLCARRRWEGAWRLSLKRLALTAMCIALPGLYTLGFLWVRDSPDTPFNYIDHHNAEWHNLPESNEGASAKAQRIYWHVTAREFVRHMGNTSHGAYLRLRWLFQQFFMYQYYEILDVPLIVGPWTFLIICPIWIFGMFRTYRKDKAAFWLLIGLGVGNTVFIATYRIYGQAADLSPLMVSGVIFLAAGVSPLFQGRRRVGEVSSLVLMGLSCVLAIAYAQTKSGRDSQDATRFLAEVDLATMPPSSAICSTWRESAALWYAKHVLTKRDDIDIINTTTTRWPERIEQLPADRPTFSILKVPVLDIYKPKPFRNLWRLQRTPEPRPSATNERS